MDETFDAVENRTRKYKKDAQKLIKEATDAGRQGQDMRKRVKNGSTANSTNSTPRKSRKNASASDLHGKYMSSNYNVGRCFTNVITTGVATGRVQKTPTKKTSPLKHETLSNTSSEFGDYTAVAATGNSFALAEMGFGDHVSSGQMNGGLYGFDSMEDDYARGCA